MRIIPSIASTLWTNSRKTCFHVTSSNVWVSSVKLSSFLLDTVQREDHSNQQERKKLSERCPTFNDLRNQVKELAQDYSFSEVGRRLVSEYLARIHYTGTRRTNTWGFNRITAMSNAFSALWKLDCVLGKKKIKPPSISHPCSLTRQNFTNTTPCSQFFLRVRGL